MPLSRRTSEASPVGEGFGKLLLLLLLLNLRRRLLLLLLWLLLLLLRLSLLLLPASPHRVVAVEGGPGQVPLYPAGLPDPEPHADVQDHQDEHGEDEEQEGAQLVNGVVLQRERKNKYKMSNL